MISFVNGNMFNYPVSAYVNPVNCIGVMGKGLALAFKNKFPKSYVAYRIACRRGQIRLGKVWLHQEGPKWVIHFPTKNHWRDSSRLHDVVSGLQSLVSEVESRPDIRSIALPAVGCGLGGLSWESVKPEIEKALADLNDIEIYVFEPH